MCGKRVPGRRLDYTRSARRVEGGTEKGLSNMFRLLRLTRPLDDHSITLALCLLSLAMHAAETSAPCLGAPDHEQRREGLYCRSEGTFHQDS